MKNLIFNKIKTTLENSGVVNHVALWNRQVEFVEEEQPFSTPAVFVEFSRIEWESGIKTIGNISSQRARGSITLHVVTNVSDFNDTETLEFSERINTVLKGLSGKTDNAFFERWLRTESSTNHNHEELVESLETFSYIGSVSY